MPSRISESLGFIRSKRDNDCHSFNWETEFIAKHVDLQKCDSEGFDDIDNGDLRESYFFNNLYDSFAILYRLQVIIEKIEYDGFSIQSADELSLLCSSLFVTSSNVMIDIDEEFSFFKKYSLLDDFYEIVSNITSRQRVGVFFLGSEVVPSINENISFSKYDEVLFQMICKNLRGELGVLLLFMVLVLFQKTPYYSSGVSNISKTLIPILREVLFNKRIVKIVVDADTHGYNEKRHNTTRMSIVFAIDNGDYYCIRLDFPHAGEFSIHLNINEPGKKRSTGFPFGKEKYTDVLTICKRKDVFDSLFYEMDNLYWFRSNYAEVVDEIKKTDKDNGCELEKFRHDCAHIVLFSSDEESKEAVTSFSEALAEALEEFEGISVYNSSTSISNQFYRYERVQDFLFKIVRGIRDCDMYSRIGYGEDNIEGARKRIEQLEIKAREQVCEFIQSALPDDEDLKECISQNNEFCVFLSRCFNSVSRRLDST